MRFVESVGNSNPASDVRSQKIALMLACKLITSTRGVGSPTDVGAADASVLLPLV